MNEDPRKLVSEQEEDMVCGYPDPDMTMPHPYGRDMTKSNKGIGCEGHGTISDQRRFGPPTWERGINQSEIARQSDDIPKNSSGRPEAHLSLNRGKPRQNLAQEGVLLELHNIIITAFFIHFVLIAKV